MAIKGKLEEIPFPRLMQFLHEKHVTGRLVLNRDDLNKVLFLVEGNPVNVESSLREETLGRYLMKKGKITEQDYEKSIELMIEQGIQQGAALVRMGKLAPRELYHEVKAQTREKLLTCFSWTRGDFSFYPEIDFVENIYRFETHFPALMYEGVSRFFPPGEIEKQLAKAGQGPVKPQPGFTEKLSEFGFSDQDTSYVFLIDGERDLKSLKQTAGNEPRAMKVFYLLLLGGLVGPEGKIENSLRSLGEMESELPPVEEFMIASPTDTSPEVVEDNEWGEPFEGLNAEEDFGEDQVSSQEPATQETSPEEGEEVIDDWDFASPAKPVSKQETMIEEEKINAEDDFYEGPPEGSVSLVEQKESDKEAASEIEGQEEPDKDENEILEFYVGHKSQDYFSLLGLSRETTDEQVLEAYRRLRDAFDRRRFGELTKEGKDKLEEINAHIIRAYETLRTSEDRRRYAESLDEAQKEKKPSSSLQAEHYLQQGTKYVRKRDWPRAQEMFEKAIEASPNEPEYHGYLGWSIYSNPELPAEEKVRRAKEHITRAIELDPRKDSSHVFMGKILKAEGNIEEAVEEFQTALRYNADCTEAKRELTARENGEW